MTGQACFAVAKSLTRLASNSPRHVSTDVEHHTLNCSLYLTLIAPPPTTVRDALLEPRDAPEQQCNGTQQVGITPTITALGPVRSDGLGPSMPTPEPMPSTQAKFQLGGTLPVVPARIVRRICGDFIDMAELTEENLELELRRLLEGDEGKPPPPPPPPQLTSYSQYQTSSLR